MLIDEYSIKHEFEQALPHLCEEHGGFLMLWRTLTQLFQEDPHYRILPENPIADRYVISGDSVLHHNTSEIMFYAYRRLLAELIAQRLERLKHWFERLLIHQEIRDSPDFVFSEDLGSSSIMYEHVVRFVTDAYRHNPDLRKQRPVMFIPEYLRRRIGYELYCMGPAYAARDISDLNASNINHASVVSIDREDYNFVILIPTPFATSDYYFYRERHEDLFNYTTRQVRRMTRPVRRERDYSDPGEFMSLQVYNSCATDSLGLILLDKTPAFRIGGLQDYLAMAQVMRVAPAPVAVVPVITNMFELTELTKQKQADKTKNTISSRFEV